MAGFFVVFYPGFGAGLAAFLKLQSIGNYVFRYCKSLNSVIFPESLMKIGTGAFDHCLSSLKLPVVRDSYAHQWAKENGKKCELTDVLDWLSN